MKSSRKIWSIPIAFVMVLLFVASVGVYSFVQAQATGTKTVTGGGTIFQDAFALTAGDLGTPIATITIPDGDDPAITTTTPPTPAVDGLNVAAPSAVPPTTEEEISGYELAGADKDYFMINATGTTGTLRVKDNEALTFIQDASKKAVFNVDVLVFVDRDVATDSGRGFRAEGTTPDSPTSNLQSGDSDLSDDRDEVNRVSVKLHALKVDRGEDALLFATIPQESNAGDRILGPDGEMKVVTVYGLPARGKVTAAEDETDYVTMVSGNAVYLKFADGFTPPTAAPDRTDTVSVTVTVHTTGDTDATTGTADDENLTAFTITIDQFATLDFDRATGADPETNDKGTADNPYSFSVRSNAAADTQIGVVSIEGARADDTTTADVNDAEVIDVIVSGTSLFTAETRQVSGVYDQIVIKVAGDLSDVTGMQALTLTINGRASLGRTAEAKVRVNVTASNNPPEASGLDADGNLVIAVTESSKTSANLVDRMTGPTDNRVLNVIQDFAGNVSDDTPDASLSYELVGKYLPFATSGSKLVISADGLLANEEKDPAVKDDPLTTTIDETKLAVYGRQGTDQGAIVDKNNEYSDVTFTFAVRISDAANTVEIPVTLTMDVNEPSTAKLTGLPTGVTVEDVAVDDDGDAATDAKVMKTYKFSMTVTDRDVPLTILDLRDLINDSDAGDSIDFDDVEGSGDQKLVVYGDRPSHFVIDDEDLLLTYMPPVLTTANPTETWLFTLSAEDTYDNSANNVATPKGTDARLRLELTITEEPPAPITSDFVSITVAEGSTDCSQVDIASGCSVAGVVAGAVSYSIESGVDGGNTDYAVDSSTGEITVITAPNFEDDKSPAFLVNAQNDLNELAGLISVRVVITDEPEAPTLTAIAGVPWVYETAQIGDDVVEKPADQDGPAATDLPISISASDPDAGAVITYTISDGKPPFAVNASTGALTVSGALDKEAAASHTFKVKASDQGGLSDEMEITVMVLNANETPQFTSPTGDAAVTTIPENTGNAHVIFTFTATDEDEDDLTFTLREGQSRDLFVIENAKSEIVDGEEVWSGELHVKTDVILDFEDAGYDPRVHVEANDPEGLNATLLLTVNLSNVNDNDPVFDSTPALSLSVPENTARGFVLANYSASDADGDHVYYSVAGDDAKSFTISATGDLMTLESLDADRNVPCGTDGCAVDVVASDGERSVSASVRISVTAIEDSVSTLGVTKANPVPGTESGHPMSALAGVKTGGDEYLWNLLDCAGMLELVDSTDEAAYCKMWDGLSAEAKAKVSAALTSEAPPESPYHLPASYGSAPVNFVETEWANWGTIVRIEVTAESPAVGCGNGNQCVVIDVNSDSADTSIKLEAYRSATQENKFVAALMLVELSENATDSDSAVYAHSDGRVARIKVDEEDEIEIKFGNLRGSIDVENEDPEISNFAPDHEAAFDDADVDYTFTVTDSNSGMPEAEDLPDGDGDADYTPVVALISTGQCETHAGSAATVKTDGGTLSMAASINEDESLYCPGTAQDGEYDASVGSTFGFAPIRDDKDFKEIDDGFDVETTIVLRENKKYYVTFIACDNAGNCSFYDPDGNDDFEELAQITVDTEDPVFVEARTGLTWDSTDNEYDDNRSFIQVIFNDLTTLNTATVEIDDFVVEGHTISDVHIFENPDDDDVDWADSGRYGADGHQNKRGIDRYRDLENVVFIELADELLADETPDVTIVPNGVEDSAGNEQDDGDHEADDWISPSFTIVSIVSTRETSQDEILAGDDDEVTVVVTTDERLDSTRPTVTVTYVNAPAGSIDTKGTALCDTDDGDDKGTRERGEIISNEDCVDSGAATGGNLNNSVEKVSNTEWIVTITEPKDTGYYNFRISGKDRSPQENPGSEGVSPSSIVTDFFDADGDVNADDAIFFEGDINLPKPEVRVSGVGVQDNEADVEFRSPLFVELDFARNHAICGANADTDERMANCTNENGEYAEDNFDDVVVTSFVLDGVDLTDSVKTTDNQSFLVSLESISIGDHTAEVQAVDQAGNVFEDTLEIDFEVNDRDPFEKRLSPGWNLVSLPGEPADSSIASVFGPGVEVRTVYSYDPVIPGGWQVAVRETLDSDWQGDLTEITGQRGYWVLSDAIQDWEVIIPRLAGGASGTGTPIQPPVIPMYAGWNLIPVTDVSGNALSANIEISAEAYLNSLDDGLDLARVLGYDTIKNEWFTVLDKQMGMVVNANLRIGAGYWVFVREAAALVPGGIAGVSGGD